MLYIFIMCCEAFNRTTYTKKNHLTLSAVVLP